jgi:Protein of unknown function (DUF3060)
VEPEDAEDRIAELERELAEAKAAARQQRQPADVPTSAQDRLAPAPRRVPGAFVLAEALPFRWWYVWALFMVAVTPIAIWLPVPLAFSVTAVLTLVALYAFQFRAATKRLALLKWGRVANVVGTELVSRGTYYSGTTYYNVYLPVAHGWTVTRERWSGPSSKTRIRYALDGYHGELVVRGREYTDGVILADQRDPARALCVTSFAYDLDHDESGNWVGKLRPRLGVGMAVWLLIVIGWLALAAVVAADYAVNLSNAGALSVSPGGSLRFTATKTTKTIACNDGTLSIAGSTNTVTVTGHCLSLTVSGNGNHVTVDTADVIRAAGVNNAVTFHSGSPRITRSGVSNVVAQG